MGPYINKRAFVSGGQKIFVGYSPTSRPKDRRLGYPTADGDARQNKKERERERDVPEKRQNIKEGHQQEKDPIKVPGHNELKSSTNIKMF